MCPRYLDEQVFQFIVDYKRANDGLSPVLRQIQDKFHISSTSVTASILDRLEGAGRIRREKGVSGIKVIGGRWSMPSEDRPVYVGLRRGVSNDR